MGSQEALKHPSKLMPICLDALRRYPADERLRENRICCVKSPSMRRKLIRNPPILARDALCMRSRLSVSLRRYDERRSSKKLGQYLGDIDGQVHRLNAIRDLCNRLINIDIEVLVHSGTRRYCSALQDESLRFSASPRTFLTPKHRCVSASRPPRGGSGARP